MHWDGEAVVLGTRKHGETSCILEVMSRDRGRHLGYVKGGNSKRLSSVLQTGNLVNVNWSSRLTEQLGQFIVEPIKSKAADLMENSLGVLGIQVLASLLHQLPEREPHPQLYDALIVIMDFLTDPVTAGATIVRFELELLRELGFGLDLSRCAATGSEDDLIWVSPKSGRAVSKEAGEPYADRLLPLPPFLRQNGQSNSSAEIDKTVINQGFSLSGYFLRRHVFEPRGTNCPDVRDRFLEALLDSMD